MSDKLTPRQNELISEALCRISVEEFGNDCAPELLKTIRRALVSELQAVTAETDQSLTHAGRSISG